MNPYDPPAEQNPRPSGSGTPAPTIPGKYVALAFIALLVMAMGIAVSALLAIFFS
jgi:hypothetical protein